MRKGKNHFALIFQIMQESSIYKKNLCVLYRTKKEIKMNNFHRMIRDYKRKLNSFLVRVTRVIKGGNGNLTSFICSLLFLLHCFS